MHELIDHVLSEVRSAWRFRWYGIGAAWFIAIAGWTFIARMPDVYEASARVYVDTSSVLQPVLRGQIVAPDVEAELAYVRESLLGAERLDAVARAVGLVSNVATPEARDALVRRLRTEIQFRSERARNSSGSSLYSLSYRHTSRADAVAVVSTLLDAFIEDTLGGQMMGGDTAGRFLAERIQAYETRLQEAEQALAEFKKQNADRLPGAEGDYFTRLNSQREALAAANQQLQTLEARREQLAQQLRGETAVVAGASAAEPPPNSIDARIQEYEARLDTLLLAFTDRHPDVIALRETIGRLKDQRDEQLAALGVVGEDQVHALGTNPVYQALQISLNEADVEITALKADIAVRVDRVTRLQNLIDEVPEVEAELARLNRDYNVIYDQYVQLVRSRETQELTQRASETDQIDFRVIDPPSAPALPVAPARLILLVGVFLAALGVGGACCYLLSLIWPVFGNVRALREQLELPVLGTVSHAWAAKQWAQRKRALLTFAIPVLAMSVVFIVVVVVEAMGPGVHGLYEQVSR